MYTRNNISIMPMNGMMLATISAGSEEKIALVWRVSEERPISLKAIMAPKHYQDRRTWEDV